MSLLWTRKRSAATPSSTKYDFPLLDFPRELRDLIYDAVLREARVDFLLALKPEKDEIGFVRPPLDVLTSDEFAKFGYGSWDDYLVHERESRASVLYYRLVAPTALVRVNKKVSQELKERFEVVDGLVASSIHLDRFVEHPEPEFLDICERSCFALRTEMMGSSTRFLHTLPDAIRERITNLVLGTKTWLSENMSNKGLLAPVFEQLPALRELGVLVDAYTRRSGPTDPGTSMYEQLHFNKHLGGGSIDVLRFMYRRPPEAARKCPFVLANKWAEFEDMMQCMRGPPPMKEYMEVGQIYQELTRAYEMARTEEEKRQMLPWKLRHEFEEWRGMKKERKRWSWVGASTVVKLTRAKEGSDVGCVGLLEDYKAKTNPANGTL
ncbi:hypothetical protein BDV96DRAFT_644421 [Lophiotrema nucula]|uniref:Uncharacterized protein n=1 Tax=Lophiotrema nucula TaxID=690887 RepID=A0A6A5ZEX7_9PLEO|nr:hypothetical protein BDV96DRAFT_644421 [Lophiotrema nucula]